MVMAVEGKRKILRSYNALGGRIYDIRYCAEQEAKFEVILDSLRPRSEDVILDDGCGTGLLLQRLNAYKVGLDFSHALLSRARVRLKQKTWTHLVQADADCLPFRHSIFNMVFAITLIQNSSRPELTLGEMRRVGRPDSRIGVTALKKAFSIDKFRKILENSGLTHFYILKDDGHKDWFAFVTLTKEQLNDK
jgi:ubiquinone/menaquinone biosynthesis C-methylase UbiE